MRPPDEPFDARPTTELLATDALLDRVGARAPTPDDLDDPLIAALALMAAEIDLDIPPADDTRDALVRAAEEFPDGPALSSSQNREHDEPPGLVIDLRDSAAVRGAGRDEGRRPPRRPRQPERVGPPVAMAPPRSLPRMPPPGAPGSPRAPRQRRERTMRPMVAVAVAVTAIVLGSGVSAALTGGRSVSPLDGIQQVVAELTHGRTQDQLTANQDVTRYLDAAQEAAGEHDYAAARDDLAKVGPLLPRLTEDDRARANARLSELDRTIPR